MTRGFGVAEVGANGFNASYGAVPSRNIDHGVTAVHKLLRWAAALIPELAPVRIAMAGMLCPRQISGGDRVLQQRHRVTALRRILAVFSGGGTCPFGFHHTPYGVSIPRLHIMTQLATLHIEKQAHKFSAAHFTIFSETKRERLHGHNYGVSARIVAEMGSNGFSADYNVYKRCLQDLRCSR